MKDCDSKRRILFAALLVFALAALAAAQPETFRAGDTVETNDGRVCKILTITGRSAKVACGASRSDLRVYSFESITSERAAQAKREQLERQKQDAANAPKPQTVIFKTGDTVTTPDGRNGVIESFKDDEMVKVRFAQNETNYFLLTDLKKQIDPSKPIFRVGDKVFSSGKPGVIETTEINGFKVRFGPGKYDWSYLKAENLMTPQQEVEEQERAQQEKIQKPLRAQFMDEAKAFSAPIYKLAPVFNPKYQHIGTGITQEIRTYEAWRKDLDSLDAVCRKYPTMTNPVMSSIYQANLNFFPADWCKIAAQRTEVLQKLKRTVGDKLAEGEIHSWTLKIDAAMRDPNGNVKDEVQTLLYDRAVWDQKHTAAMKKHYLDAGGVSPELFKPLDEKVAELKARIKAEAPTRSWEQPKFKEAALEATARREFSTDLPGVKVLNSGIIHSTWDVNDGKDYIGGNSGGWSYYRIIKGASRNRYGRALVQLPNRPFCQSRPFQITQLKSGAGYGSTSASSSDSGVFVKCP